MRWIAPSLLFALVAVFTALAACGEEEGEKKDPAPADRHATSLEPSEVAMPRADVRVMESHPVQFAVTANLPMPTPGWTLKVASVGKPDDTGRIVVHVDATGPKNMVAQVITAVPLTVNLGSLTVGDHLVDVLMRTGANEPYRRVALMPLTASR
jgi:hypothetical protein